MNYNNFCENIKTHIQNTIGDIYKVSLTKVNKLNGVILQSIVILQKDESIAPNIYLEDYFKEYLNGKPFVSIAADIMALYFTTKNQPEISCSFITDINQAKDRIFYKLVNYEKNQELLKDLPHIKWMDLAIIFCVLIQINENGICSVNINKTLLNHWNLDTEKIFEFAAHNTPLLFDPSVKLMDDIIKDIVCSRIENPNHDQFTNTIADSLLPDNKKPEDNFMYVATNCIGINGATLSDDILISV